MVSLSRNGIITITRGDCFEFPLCINIGTKISPQFYTLQDDDVVCFYLCEPHQLTEHALLKKCYTKSDAAESGEDVDKIKIKFDSKDTFYLVPGTYYYEVKLVNTTNSEIRTIISRTQFIILE